MQLGAARRPDPTRAFAPLTEGEKHDQIKLDIKERTTDSSRGAFSREDYYAPTRSTPLRDNTASSYAAPKDASVKNKYELSDEWNKPLRIASDKRGGFTDTPASTLTPKSSKELLERYRTAKPAVAEPALSVQEPDAPITTLEEAPMSSDNTPQLPQYKIVGEAFDCYVFVEIDSHLLVIDKHAAHERIIFENLKKTLNSLGSVLSQTLLLPVTVILSPEALSAAVEYREDLMKVGFEFSETDGACDLYAIPDGVSPEDAETLFAKMADELVEGRGNPQLTDMIRREKALYQIACKAAIKGGRSYNSDIIKNLVEEVLSLPDITVCPHGRPIAYKLTKNELDRQFDRIK
jgi:DNA mismatch repair protein MutL